MKVGAITSKLADLKKALPRIRSWLSERGAEVLEPTNEYEVLRFKAANDTHIVYRGKSDKLTINTATRKILQTFVTNGAWRAQPATARKSVAPKIKTIRERDGDLCFFCGITVSDADASADHLVPITHKGPNHIGNLVLMHTLCNQRAGAMSAPEKIKAHVEWRTHA